MSLVFVRGIHRWPANSPQEGPVTWTMFPFDDVIMLKHHGISIPLSLKFISKNPVDNISAFSSNDWKPNGRQAITRTNDGPSSSWTKKCFHLMTSLSKQNNAQKHHVHIASQLFITGRLHYGDVTLSTMASHIAGVSIVYSVTLFRHRSKKASNLTGDRWIPLTKGQ